MKIRIRIWSYDHMIICDNYLNTSFPPASGANSNAETIARTNKILVFVFFLMVDWIVVLLEYEKETRTIAGRNEIQELCFIMVYWMMVYQNMKNRTVLIVYDTFWLVLGLFWLFTICYVSSYLETFWLGTSEKKVLALKKCWFWYISKDAFTNIIQYNDTIQWYTTMIQNDAMTQWQVLALRTHWFQEL